MEDEFFADDIDWDSELKEIDFICDNYELAKKKDPCDPLINSDCNHLPASDAHNVESCNSKSYLDDNNSTFVYGRNSENMEPFHPSSHPNTRPTLEHPSKSNANNVNDGKNDYIVDNRSFHPPPFDAPTLQSSIFQTSTVRVDETAALTWHYPAHKEKRDYQFHITQQALFSNTMVCLPTGLGKTFIASVVMHNYYRWFPEGIIIFLAPTKPLVEQQIEACINIVGIPQEKTIFMTGTMPPRQRSEFWKTKKVFFVTGQTLQQDILEHKICPVKNIVCLVVDEAHRALGRYAYVVVVEELMRAEINFRILALTATPGKDYKTIQQVINNLKISHLEIRNENDDDVKKYIFKTNEELIKVNQKESFKFLTTILQEELATHVSFLCSHKLFFCKNMKDVAKYTLYQASLSFRQRGFNNMRPNLIQTAERHFANSMFLASIIEAISVFGLKSALALWDDNKDGRISKDSAKLIQALNIMRREISHGFSSPKLTILENKMLDYYCKNKARNENSRTIIFSSLRESVCEIIELLNKHTPHVKAKEFVGQSKSGIFFKGQSQKEQQRILRDFRQGIYNTLVATSIGEEGLDISDVDLIICFDVVSTLRMIQRIGRTGRKKDGHAIILASEGKEYQKYGQDKRNHCMISRKIHLNQDETFKFYESPRMLSHKFAHPEVVFTSTVPPTYLNLEIKRHAKEKQRIFDPGSDPLTNSEKQILSRRKSVLESRNSLRYVPCLVAFPSFQTRESKYFSVAHSSVTTKLFVSTMKVLREKKGKMYMEDEFRKSSDKLIDFKQTTINSSPIHDFTVANQFEAVEEYEAEELNSPRFSPTWIHGFDCVPLLNDFGPKQAETSDQSLKIRNSFKDRERSEIELNNNEVKKAWHKIDEENDDVNEMEGHKSNENEKTEMTKRRIEEDITKKNYPISKLNPEITTSLESHSNSGSSTEYVSNSKSSSDLNNAVFQLPRVETAMNCSKSNTSGHDNFGNSTGTGSKILNAVNNDCFTPPHRPCSVSLSETDFPSSSSSTKQTRSCSRSIVFRTPSPVSKFQVNEHQSESRTSENNQKLDFEIPSNLNLESLFEIVEGVETSEIYSRRTLWNEHSTSISRENKSKVELKKKVNCEGNEDGKVKKIENECNPSNGVSESGIVSKKDVVETEKQNDFTDKDIQFHESKIENCGEEEVLGINNQSDLNDRNRRKRNDELRTGDSNTHHGNLNTALRENSAQVNVGLTVVQDSEDETLMTKYKRLKKLSHENRFQEGKKKKSTCVRKNTEIKEVENTPKRKRARKDSECKEGGKGRKDHDFSMNFEINGKDYDIHTECESIPFDVNCDGKCNSSNYHKNNDAQLHFSSYSGNSCCMSKKSKQRRIDENVNENLNQLLNSTIIKDYNNDDDYGYDGGGGSGSDDNDDQNRKNEFKNDEDDFTQIVRVDRKRKINKRKKPKQNIHVENIVDEDDEANNCFEIELMNANSDGDDGDGDDDDEFMNIIDVPDSKSKRRKRLKKVGERNKKSEEKINIKNRNAAPFIELIEKNRKKKRLSATHFIDDEAEVSEGTDISHEDEYLEDFICTNDVEFINDAPASIEKKSKGFLDNENENNLSFQNSNRKTDDRSIYWQSLLSQHPIDTSPISKKVKQNQLPKFVASPSKFGNRNKNKMRYLFTPLSSPPNSTNLDLERRNSVSMTDIDSIKDTTTNERGTSIGNHGENKENYDEHLNCFTNQTKKNLSPLLNLKTLHDDIHSSKYKMNCTSSSPRMNEGKSTGAFKSNQNVDLGSKPGISSSHIPNHSQKISTENNTHEDDFFEGLDLDAIEREMEEEYQTRSQYFQKNEPCTSAPPTFVEGSNKSCMDIKKMFAMNAEGSRNSEYVTDKFPNVSLQPCSTLSKAKNLSENASEFTCLSVIEPSFDFGIDI